jgi:hypothetical protein
MPTGATDGPLPDAADPIDPYPLDAASEAERQLFALLNGERQRAGLPDLSWNGNVALVAREHSEAARGAEDVDLETTFRARIEMPAAANFARAGTVADAHAAFMQTMSQRMNILSPQLNQVGVGVIEEPSGGIIATEIIVRATPRLDTSSLAKQLRKQLPDYELGTSSDLDAIAQTFASALAAGKTAEAVWPRVRSKVHEIDRLYTKIFYSTVVSVDASNIQAAQLFTGQERGNDIGIGVAQSSVSPLRTGLIHVVLVIGIRLRNYKSSVQ